MRKSKLLVFLLTILGSACTPRANPVTPATVTTLPLSAEVTYPSPIIQSQSYPPAGSTPYPVTTLSNPTVASNELQPALIIEPTNSALSPTPTSEADWLYRQDPVVHLAWSRDGKTLAAAALSGA